MVEFQFVDAQLEVRNRRLIRPSPPTTNVSAPSPPVMVMWPRAATNVSSRPPPVRVSLPGDPTTSCAIPSAASSPVGSTPPKVPLCRSVATKASLCIAVVSVSRRIKSDRVVPLISFRVCSVEILVLEIVPIAVAQCSELIADDLTEGGSDDASCNMILRQSTGPQIDGIDGTDRLSRAPLPSPDQS